jgi:hypothetical protein
MRSFLSPILMQPRWLLALFAALLCAHVAASMWLTQHVFYIPDEIVYAKMSEALRGGSLAIATGYETFASPLFVFGLSALHEGAIYPQYPPMSAVFALPFTLLLGDASGLFALNAICFVLILWLVYRIQLQLFASPASGWLAVTLSAFGGFLWLYSQAVVPHLLQIALLLAAAHQMLRAHHAANGVVAGYIWAGLLATAALGVRYDSVFALPMLLLPAFFAKPVQWRGLVIMGAGIAAGLLALSAINYMKFGTFMPFDYGTSNPAGHATFKPLYALLLAAAIAALALLWGITRLPQKQLALLRKPVSKLAIIAASLLVLYVATNAVAYWLWGFWLTVVDYSILPLQQGINASAARSPDGGFLYLGEYKRALLQSAPFIALISLFVLQPRLQTTRREWVWLLWLACTPAAFIFFYSLLRWDGGFDYHMRYYTPVLPFAAMLAAHALWRFIIAVRLSDDVRYWVTPLLCGTIASVAAAFIADGLPQAQREWWLLSMPLWLWAVVPFAAVLALAHGAALFLRQLALLMFGFAAFWGGATSIGIIYPHLNDYKSQLAAMSDAYAPHIENEAVVISVPRYFTGFFADPERRLMLGTIFEDGTPITLEDVQALLTFFMQQHTPVYITEDVRALPYIRAELPAWGLALERVYDGDEALQLPALSRFRWQQQEMQKESDE